MAKKGKRARERTQKTQRNLHASKGLRDRFLKAVLRTFVPLTFIAGAWIYWPRNGHPFVPGLGIQAQCSVAPDVNMNAQVIDAVDYRIGLNFGDVGGLGCTQLRIVAPSRLLDVVQLHDVRGFSSESLGNVRRRFTKFALSTNALGQPVLSIPVSAIGPDPFIIELELEGVVQESFEDYRMLIPKALEIDREENLSRTARVLVESVVVPAKFESVDISPPPVKRTRQFGGFELLYFGGIELSEISVLLVDRARKTWKEVFVTFALATAMSVLAAGISKATEK